MKKKNVAVVMGGFSGEHEVSMKSGKTIYENLCRDTYSVYRVEISKEGWYFLDDRGLKIPIDKSNFSAHLQSGYSITFDICFNTIHGIPGENGSIQAYWDMIGQRYTGCSSYQSALTFNKKDLLSVLSTYGVLSAPRKLLKKGESLNTDTLIQELGLPLFVKPNQSGSSLGASKVNTAEELPAAMEKAFAEDDEILIEKYLDGVEVSVGVVDFDGEAKVLGITEIVSQNDFFDFEAKYQGASEEITPARISDDERKKVEEAALKAYNSIGMSGFSRSEFIIVDGIPYFLEMNTNPGFSPASILPQQAQMAGISLKDLCGNEVEKALKKPLAF